MKGKILGVGTITNTTEALDCLSNYSGDYNESTTKIKLSFDKSTCKPIAIGDVLVFNKVKFKVTGLDKKSILGDVINECNNTTNKV